MTGFSAFVAYAEAAGLTTMSDSYYPRGGWAENEKNEGAVAVHRDTSTGYVYLSARCPDGSWHRMAGPA